MRQAHRQLHLLLGCEHRDQVWRRRPCLSLPGWLLGLTGLALLQSPGELLILIREDINGRVNLGRLCLGFACFERPTKLFLLITKCWREARVVSRR